MIEDNGGIVYDIYETYSFMIKPDNECDSPHFYHTGRLFSERWISDSIQAETLLDKGPYLLGFIKDSKMRTVPKKGANYTIIEVL